MTKIVINAAMVPNEGTFTYRNISRDVAATWLREHGPRAISYVGYPQTAEHCEFISAVFEQQFYRCSVCGNIKQPLVENEGLRCCGVDSTDAVWNDLPSSQQAYYGSHGVGVRRRVAGIRPALNRAKTTMQPGDEALVVKLAYRVADPATKGQPQPEDWEYGLLVRER